jgi:hypothetical protein
VLVISQDLTPWPRWRQGCICTADYFYVVHDQHIAAGAQLDMYAYEISDKIFIYAEFAQPAGRWIKVHGQPG